MPYHGDVYLHEKSSMEHPPKNAAIYHLLIPSLYHTTKEYEFYRPYIRLINKAWLQKEFIESASSFFSVGIHNSYTQHIWESSVYM